MNELANLWHSCMPVGIRCYRQRATSSVQSCNAAQALLKHALAHGALIAQVFSKPAHCFFMDLVILLFLQPSKKNHISFEFDSRTCQPPSCKTKVGYDSRQALKNTSQGNWASTLFAGRGVRNRVAQLILIHYTGQSNMFLRKPQSDDQGRELRQGVE